MSPEFYRFIEHTADIGIEIAARHPKEIFERAALALADLLTDPALLTVCDRQAIEIDGQDWEDLLINWLRELLYLYNGESKAAVDVRLLLLEPTRLRAEIGTADISDGQHEIRNEIKAVTYHQLAVWKDGDTWRARVIFDI